MEVITDNSYDIFDFDGNTELEIIGKYISDKANKNGIITLKKGGFEVDFALILAYNPIVDDKPIYILGERKNTNKDGGSMGIPESEIKIDDKKIWKIILEQGTLHQMLKIHSQVKSFWIAMNQRIRLRSHSRNQLIKMTILMNHIKTMDK